MAKAALLVIVGEPFLPGHKDLILSEVTKAFRSWNADHSGIDINSELAHISDRASPGQEGPDGERVIQYRSSLLVEILVNPFIGTVKKSIKNFLIAPVSYRHIIFAGHSFHGTGAWIFQDDSLSYKDFTQIFKDVDVETALKGSESVLNISCTNEGQWNNEQIKDSVCSKYTSVVVNNVDQMADVAGVIRFVAYLSPLLDHSPITSLLPPSDIVGNIRFNKPTIYIFPGYQGDSCMFGVNGFNLLVNGGYSRKSCFWDFVCHLDRIDAILLTHIGVDNTFGIASTLERKCMENVYPEIGYFISNLGVFANKPLSINAGKDIKPNLSVNLIEEGISVLEYCKQLGQELNPCMRSSKEAIKPFNLYRKVGHGTLDMYTLNPIDNSKEVNDFIELWSKGKDFPLRGGIPLENIISICALIVWSPDNPTENIIRILFNGNSPQTKLFSGLDKLTDLEILKHPVCCSRSLFKKPSAEAATGKRATATRSVTSKTYVSKATTQRKVPSAPSTSSLRTSHERPLSKNTSKTSVERKKTVPEAQKKLNSVKKTEAVNVKEKSDPKNKSTVNKVSDTKSAPLNTEIQAAVDKSLLKNNVAEPLVNNDRKDISVDQQQNNEPLSVQLSHQSQPINNMSENTSELATQPQCLPDPSFSPVIDSERHIDGDFVNSQYPISNGDVFSSPNDHSGHINVKDYLVPSGTSSDVKDDTEAPSQYIADPLAPSVIADGREYLDYQQNIGSCVAPTSDRWRETISISSIVSNTTLMETDDSVLSMSAAADDSQLSVLAEEFGHLFSNVKVKNDFDLKANRPVPEPNAKCDNSGVVFSENDSPLMTLVDEKRSSQMTFIGKNTDEKLRSIESCSDHNEASDDVEDSNITQDLQTRNNTNVQDAVGCPAADQAHEIASSDDQTINDTEVDSQPVNMADASDYQTARNPAIDHASDVTEKSFLFKPASFSSDINDQQSVSKENLQSSISSVLECDKNTSDALDSLYYTPDTTISTDNIGFSPDSIVCNKENSNSDKILTDVKNPDELHEDFDKTMEHAECQFVGSSGETSVPSKATDKLLDMSDRENSQTHDGSHLKPDQDTIEHSNINRGNDETCTNTNEPFDAVKEWGEPSALPPPIKEGKQSIFERLSKSRPSTAPSTTRSDTGRSQKTSRISLASASRSADMVRVIKPIYVDLTYIPGHGDPAYCGIEFFQTVRARYYVLSSLNHNADTLTALMNAKKMWEDSNVEVTLIPTYESENLRHWLALNQDKLTELKIDVVPAASRCTIQLQDRDTNCLAYRLEF